MALDTQRLADGWIEFWGELVGAFDFLRTGIFSLLFQPWGQIQILLLLLLYGACFFAARYIEPKFEAWIRDLDTTRQRLKTFAIVLRRLRLLFFVIGGWLIWFALRTTTWPSRSYLIGVVTSIATAWLVSTLIGKLVQNRLLARLMTLTVVVFAVLQALGMVAIASAVLDSASLWIGTFRISLLSVVKTTIMLAVLLTLAQLVSGFIERRVQTLEDFSPSMRVLTGKLARISLFTLAIVFGLQAVGLDLTTLTVFSGAIGLGIGFGLQKVVSNLISGVILLLDKSVKPGDVIEVGNTFGWISTLGARFVSVVTRDGREYLIPNEDLITNQVVNWSHSNSRVRLEIEFGVSYEADPLTVRKVAIEAAGQPKRVLGVPAPVCHLISFGESSVDYVLRFWIADPSAGVINVKSDVMIALWYALKENEISIPYPRRDLQISQPLTVRMESGEESDLSPPPQSRRAKTTRSSAPKPR